jgi:hypothetical protein
MLGLRLMRWFRCRLRDHGLDTELAQLGLGCLQGLGGEFADLHGLQGFAQDPLLLRLQPLALAVPPLLA